MVNDFAKRCKTRNVFAGKRNFSLNKAKKEKKNFFCGKFVPTLEVREKARNGFFVEPV